MKECVPRYANGQTRKMLAGANEAVREYYLEARKHVRSIQGETPAQTRKLRALMFRDDCRDLSKEIDSKWKKIYNDDEVENYFMRDRSEKQGRKKYRGLIQKSWNMHKRYRNNLWSKLLSTR